VPEALRRWIRDEGGQDLIEYALLSSFIGFSCVVAISILSGTMNAVYTSYDTAVQSDPLVQVPEPK
jgi:Flp pilus assembly pilin Flp